MGVGALVAHHTDGANVGKHGERLPDVALQAGQTNLLAHDEVRVLQQRHLVGGHLTDDAHAQAGSRKRLSPDDLVGQSQFEAQTTHLVLEQRAQRFDQTQRHVLGQATHVVVALDDRRRAVAAATLDDVGVQGSLHEELGVGDATRVLFEHPHEQLADDLSLGLGFGHTTQALEELRAGVDVDQFDAQIALERLDHLVALVLAHQTGVDVDTGELRADGLVHEGGRHRRIDTAGQTADDALVPHLLANEGHLLVDDRAHGPRRVAVGQIVEEPTQHVGSERRVHHLGVILNAPDTTIGVLEHGHRSVGSAGRGHESVGNPRDGVEVTHPHVLFGGDVAHQQRGVRSGDA